MICWNHLYICEKGLIISTLVISIIFLLLIFIPLIDLI